MSRLTRCFWICLMVLALPVQGMAAAARVHCATGPAAQVQPSDAAGPHAAHAMQATRHAAMDHSARHAADHAVDDAAADVTAPAADAAASIDDGSGSISTPGCSACAACCAGLAMAHAMPSVPAALPAHPDFVAGVPLIVARPADGPERPPRPVFA